MVKNCITEKNKFKKSEKKNFRFFDVKSSLASSCLY